MSLPVIKLGLVGGIAHSAMPLLNALIRQSRLQLVEVYDSCLALAKENAHQLDATWSESLDGLLRRCEGVVFGQVGWMGIEPLIRALTIERPSLLLQSVHSRLGVDDLLKLSASARENRCLLMPELSYRWARSTLRLRELTATQAGAIENLELTCGSSIETPVTLLAYDWCCNVIQSECRSVMTDPAAETVTLKFRRVDRTGEPVSATLRFLNSTTDADFSSVSATIVCRHGRIQLNGEDKLNWEVVGQKASEQLNRDRTAHDVMFDLFGRRLVGGLVPIPEIGDLIKAHEISQAVRRSFDQGKESPVQPLSSMTEQ